MNTRRVLHDMPSSWWRWNIAIPAKMSFGPALFLVAGSMHACCTTWCTAAGPPVSDNHGWNSEQHRHKKRLCHGRWV